jgi:hypothetical protein
MKAIGCHPRRQDARTRRTYPRAKGRTGIVPPAQCQRKYGYFARPIGTSLHRHRSRRNPVPTRATVDALKLDVAERADVVVEMNNPGIWVFGSTDDDDRNMGMGVVVEYENQSGEPRWTPPPNVN